ncbi:Pre-mRNA-splicing factor brr2 [Wickerhamiella sorbophila]|uniref:U5 small nuclear ribonucleoprotein 200 kDa helicase n=1 Tax=Wickerhamiella sorbophila TaxID=45607 RepID=A0A2T0FK95_9ASCO|nr:Pre-mRNA-splicing factor brr2 [Wickerhamiella sorbophila]PRT55411.1 Pre-mRNA-splicing factor brr2 [Wickerhamiella sorbophila]
MPEVLSAPRRNGSGDGGAAESLQGKVSVETMGDRVVRTKPQDGYVPPKSSKGRSGEDSYALVAAFVAEFMSDLPDEIIRSVTEAVVSVVRDEDLTEQVKITELEDLLDTKLSTEKYNSLLNIVRRIPLETDVEIEEQDVAVTFDDGMDFETESEDDDDSEASELPPMPAPEIAVDRDWLANFIEPTGKTVRQVLAALEAPPNQQENELLELFEFEHLDIVKVLVLNRDRVLWLTRLHMAETGPDRDQVLTEMETAGMSHLLDQAMQQDQPAIVDLELLEMDAKKIHAPKVILPEGSERVSVRSYEQYTIPYSQDRPDPVTLIDVDSLPKWMQPAFTIKTLNNVQSTVCDFALNSDGNLLVCAPTGAGKTTIALLAMLSCIANYRKNDTIDLSAFKMVYISPLKALVQEQVREFSKRLAPFGISVAELSGDQTLSHDQLANTQLIIATPEKWDVVTRKTTDISYTALTRLLVIDEIHLLHDPRGPALESIVARSLKFSQDTLQPLRLVGLSATLPNYKDVAHFLQADKGVFSFDSRYRPCPLTQIFIGITEKKPFKALTAMNDACWDKVQEYAAEQHQMIVFVHSRKDTFKTAQFLLDRSLEESKQGLFKANQKPDCDNPVLADLVTQGLAVHHAGLSRKDRTTVETLFAERKITVLVSTATLAWGINLPAHAVIIKGTQVYNPQAGSWQELQPQDVLQMLGRAGRPGFDRFGEGVVITQHAMLNYYLGISTANLPIESRLISRISDMINAEVALGSIKKVEDAVEWLGRTYYYIRMLRDRVDYRVGPEYDDDEFLVQRRRDLAHTALSILRKDGLITYDGNDVKITKLGRISADFYITPDSMATYGEQLKSYLDIIDIMRVFSRSSEFKYIPVRIEERVELNRLVNLVPIPVKEPPTEPVAKMNVLLQAYICRLSLSGFALASDMIYVVQSASRLIRAMFEIAVANKWAQLARKLLDLFKMVDRRMWLTSTPFRQFPTCPVEVIRKTEASMLPWERYFDLDTPAELGQAIRSPRDGELVLSLLHQFPRFSIEAQAQPLTHTMVRVNVEITPTFDWNSELHNKAERFWLAVDDGQDNLLYSEWYICRENTETQTASLPIIMNSPLPANLFVSLISDRWLHSESTAVVSLRHASMPRKFLAPLVVEKEQVRAVLLETDENVYVGQMNHWQEYVKMVYDRHRDEPGTILVLFPQRGQTEIARKLLDGEVLTDDLSVFAQNKMLLAWVGDFERLTRRWRRRRALHIINVLVCVDLHTIGGHYGFLYELCILRIGYMSTQLEKPLRVVGVGLPVAPIELGAWLGASKGNIFSVSSKLNWEIKSVIPRPYKSQMLVLARPVLEEVKVALESGKSVVVWVSDHSQVRRTLKDLLRLAAAAQFNLPVPTDSEESKFLILPQESLEKVQCDVSIIMNTEKYDANEDRYAPYTAARVVEMVASGSQATVYTPLTYRDYYTKFLSEPLPVESHVQFALADSFAVEISEEIIQSAADAIDWLTYTYMFTRLKANPTYYGVKSVSEDDVNEFLSELVESNFEELSEADAIDVDGDEMAVSPRNGAFIAAHYALSTQTLAILSKLGSKFRLRTLLEQLCSAGEMEAVPLHGGDDIILNTLSHQLPLQFSDASLTPNAKAFYLIQAHLSRVQLPSSQASDLLEALDVVLRLIKATIDVLAGDGYLSVLTALDLHQMVTQGMWAKESPLLQLPHVTRDIIDRCKDHDILGIHDFMAIEDDDLRLEVLGMKEGDERLVDIANFVNRYPSVDLTAKPDGAVIPGEPAHMLVVVERDVDEDTQVIGKLPWNTRESWYIIIGNPHTKELYGFKKTQLVEEEQTISVEFTIPEATASVTVWCACDSYIDADKQVIVDL